MTTLASLNELELSEQGVWQAADTEEFSYSDGAEAEQALAEILSAAQDLSSCSTELEAAITDWPTEYHLSAKRANLLKPLDLSGVSRVLELGSGCGAISRYLGEQHGVSVDAVEGSEVRASLAALRCRDLQSVQIHSANFNTLEFPAKTYDLILFVGVTEYAGRYSQQASDQAALQELLGVARRALKPDGVVLIAIENRLGLKYLQGACEDHYGEPWVGINDYPQSNGIRTYSKSQWNDLIEESGFSESLYCYPFPDYKVPSVVVHHAAVNSEESCRAIAKTRSRDYLRPFELLHEPQLWQGLAQAKGLDHLANSFMILLSHSDSRLREFAKFTVVEYEHTAYDWQTNARQPSPNEQRLQARLARVTEQNEQLSARLQLIESSRLWRWLTRLRAIFGRSAN